MQQKSIVSRLLDEKLKVWETVKTCQLTDISSLHERLWTLQMQLNLAEQILFLSSLQTCSTSLASTIKEIQLTRQEIMRDICQTCTHYEEDCVSRYALGHFQAPIELQKFAQVHLGLQRPATYDLPLTVWQNTINTTCPLQMERKGIPVTHIVLDPDKESWKTVLRRAFFIWLATSGKESCRIAYIHIPTVCSLMPLSRFQTMFPLWFSSLYHSQKQRQELKEKKEINETQDPGYGYGHVTLFLDILDNKSSLQTHDYLQFALTFIRTYNYSMQMECVVVGTEQKLDCNFLHIQPSLKLTLQQLEAIVMSGRTRYHQHITEKKSRDRETLQSLLTWNGNEQIQQHVMDVKWAAVLRKNLASLTRSIEYLWLVWQDFVVESNTLATASHSQVQVCTSTHKENSLCQDVLHWYKIWCEGQTSVLPTTAKKETCSSNICLSTSFFPSLFILYLLSIQHQLQIPLLLTNLAQTASFFILRKSESEADVFVRQDIVPVCALHEISSVLSSSIHLFIDVGFAFSACKVYADTKADHDLSKLPMSILLRFVIYDTAQRKHVTVFVKSRLPQYKRHVSLQEICIYAQQIFSSPLDAFGTKDKEEHKYYLTWHRVETGHLLSLLLDVSKTPREINWCNQFPILKEESKDKDKDKDKNKEKAEMYGFNHISGMAAKFPVVNRYIHPWIRTCNIVQSEHYINDKESTTTMLDPLVFQEMANRTI